MLIKESRAAGLVGGSQGGAAHPGQPCGALLSYEQIKSELIEAVELIRRLPGEGRWPFASDGPWHLITRQVRASAAVGDRLGIYSEHEAARQEIEQQETRDLRNTAPSSPLTAREVDWLEVRLKWLELVPEADRKLVLVTTRHISRATRTGKRLKWRRVREELLRNRQWQDVGISDRGLGMRYSRAIGALCQELNRRAARRIA